MEAPNRSQLRDLLERIARLSAAGEWSEFLNPAQRGALGYLARANRFSRAPSHVADFMCTTRGTASQTLKALEAKGLIELCRSSSDKRRVSYNVTDAGRSLLDAPGELDTALDTLSVRDANALQQSLEWTLKEMLSRRDFRSFGICMTCRHHTVSKGGRACELLSVQLTDTDAGELCHEHVAAEPR